MDKRKLSVEQESNKIIAEYMDYTNNYWYQNNELHYHESWSMLMPVIKKLNGGRPHSAVLWEDITKALIDCDIERTWVAVVNYIKWFYKK